MSADTRRPLIYLDAAASTPIDPAVLAAVTESMQESAANPGSAHWAGRRAAGLARTAREQVAALTGHGPADVIFTSGATEANNLALRGLLQPLQTSAQGGGRRGVVTARTEHPSVLATVRALTAPGVPVRLVDTDPDGLVDLEHLLSLVDHTTMIVSLMAANNETGVLLDIGAAADIAHEAGAFLHVDASQLLAWGPLATNLDVDLVTVSGHKMHGPQGIGALVASSAVRHQLEPTVTGGGQQGGLRSGTINVAGAVGLGVAAEQALRLGPDAADRIAMLRDRLHNTLLDDLAAIIGPNLPQLNGHAVHRLPGTVNLAFGDSERPADAEQILAVAATVAASAGSACHAGVPGPSPVLMAMGYSPERAESSIRLSLSRLTTAAEVAAAAPALVSAVAAVAGAASVGSTAAASSEGSPGPSRTAPVPSASPARMLSLTDPRVDAPNRKEWTA